MLPLPHGEVVPSGLPGCPAPARLARGWQPPRESTAARHPSTSSWPGPRSRGGVPTGSPTGRGGGAGGERQRGAGSSGSRGSAGVSGRWRAGGGGGFLAAGFTAELVVAGDGAVAGQDLHLAEDGLVPEARLPWRGTEQVAASENMKDKGSIRLPPLHLSNGPKGQGAPLAGCCQTCYHSLPQGSNFGNACMGRGVRELENKAKALEVSVHRRKNREQGMLQTSILNPIVMHPAPATKRSKQPLAWSKGQKPEAICLLG